MLRDQVDEHAEVRQADDENRPARLAPAREVGPAKDVAEDGDQEPEPDHPREEDEHRPDDVQEGVVRCKHRLHLRLTRGDVRRHGGWWIQTSLRPSEPPAIVPMGRKKNRNHFSTKGSSLRAMSLS